MLISNNAIIEQNTHWASGIITKCRFEKQRLLYDTICPWLKQKQIISIEGLRRTGKSVLMQQLKDKFAKDCALSASRFFYFSFELEDLFELLPSSSLEQILHYYFYSILNTHPAEFNTPVLICLDELQNVSGWQSVIKRYYDLNSNIKFIISGSASLFLKEGAESLAGRIMEFTLCPLDFQEFLFFFTDNNEYFPNSIEDLFGVAPIPITSKRQMLFEQFLLAGGFPETVTMLSSGITISEAQSYINQSITNKIIGRDLRRYFAIKSSAIDFKLFNLLCLETGAQLNLENLSADTGVSKETLKYHIDVLESAHILSRLFIFDTKARRSLKVHPKIYLVSPSIILSALGHSTLPSKSLTGHIIESYVYNRLHKLSDELYFARTSSNQEVDFYCPKEKVMIESKYSEVISASAKKQLLRIADKYSLRALFITEKDTTDFDIRMIPACYL